MRIAKESDLRKLVVLHCQFIPYSINARLGEVWLAALYKQHIRAPGRYSFVATGENLDEPIGGIFCTSISELHFRKTFPRVSLKDIIHINWKVLFTIRAVDFRDLLQIHRVIARLEKDGQFVYINSWFAKSTNSFPKIGSQLLKHFIITARGDGFVKVYVDVRKDNARAFDRYDAEGFKVCSTTSLSYVLVKNLLK